MHKKQDLKNIIINETTIIYNEEDEVITVSRAKVKNINPAQIITPQPYSVYALCKLYEHYQRN